LLIVPPLYELDAKAMASSFAPRRFLARAGDLANSATLGFGVYTHNDPDTVVLIQGVEFLWIPVAAAAARSGELQHLDAAVGGAVFTIVGQAPTFLQTGERFVRCVTGVNIALFATEALQASMRFSAAGINNAATVSVWGWAIPRGTLQR